MSKLEKVQKSYTFKPLVLKFSHINLKIAKLRSSYAFNNNCSELVRSQENASNANNKTIPNYNYLLIEKRTYIKIPFPAFLAQLHYKAPEKISSDQKY